jgi:putative ABC transport system permease protein
MGTLQLIIKQMRQRALGSWLTLLSVLLGVALAISILLLRDAGQALFGQTEYGYDVMVGVGKGSPTQLVMNTVYHIDKSPGNMPYWVYEQLNAKERPPKGSKEFDIHHRVKLAVPTAVGDVYKGRPIIGTLPKMFQTLAPLEAQIQQLQDRQDVLSNTVRERRSSPAQLPADAADKQNALATAVEQVRQQVIQTGREGTPITEPHAPDAATPSKWRYGDPASETAAAAVQELRAATESLTARDATSATAHQDKATALLKRVHAAVSAESGALEYQKDKTFAMAEGHVFAAWKFEAVIGAEVARNAGLKIGSKFQATHGNPPPGAEADTHPEQWEVVGILKPTHTAADRCLYIPLITFFSIAEHEGGLQAHRDARSGVTPNGKTPDAPQYKMAFGDELLPDLPHTQDFIKLDVPESEWEVSAIAIESRGGVTGGELIYFINNGGLPDVQAVNPAQVMQVFFATFLGPSTTILLLISFVVSIVAGVGILVSIYNSVSARTREIAILRALGATRGRILTLICAEAVLIGLAGGLMGLLVGHALGGVASAYLNNTVGQGFSWYTTQLAEWVYLLIVAVISLLAGLVPAMKAYRTPVATNLVAA